MTVPDACLPRTSAEDACLLEVKKVLAGMADARLAFQPVVDLDDGSVVGYEALARFGTGHRSPLPYLQAADALQRRPELEARLVQSALDARADLPEDCFLALNVTPELLTAGPVWDALRGGGSLDGLVVELTEHLPVDNLTRLRRRLDSLRERGAVLALDDVGAGWSGLQQIVELRPEIVKVDRSLVHLLHEDQARRAVTELLGAFTDKVGGQLLAEGVEQFDELTTLLGLNVHLAQGWLLGRPQFGWPSVQRDVHAILVARSRGDRSLGSLAQPAPWAPNVAAIGFLGDALPQAALLTDAQHAVRALWVRNNSSTGPSGWTRPLDVHLAKTPLRAALARAMERPEETRFDPLVCAETDGTIVGLVHVDALVDALL